MVRRSVVSLRTRMESRVGKMAPWRIKECSHR